MLIDSKMNRHWKAALTSIALIAIGFLTWLPNPSRAQSAVVPQRVDRYEDQAIAPPWHLPEAVGARV